MLFRTRRPIVLAAFLLLFPLQAFSQTASKADYEQAEQNRQMVANFYNQFFNKYDLSAAQHVSDEKYIQHNPQLGNGKEVFLKVMSAAFKRFPKRQNNIVRSAANGDLVFVHVHRVLTPGDRGDAIVDIFRVENGKIVEHWDVIQPVPEKSANTNTMF